MSDAVLSLREQAQAALRLSGNDRLELLLHAAQPMRLVRSLPDSEIYFTIRDVGPFDSLPLLALTSAPQLIHLIDLEAWRVDRFDADRAGAWVALILESGEPSIVRFLRAADDELLALLFCKWTQVRQLDEEDESDDGFPSPDGLHRFVPNNPEHARAIRRIAEIFMTDDVHRYTRILRLAEWELPSQLEESALHWRTSRLEEHGFPGFDAALSVYGAPEGISTLPFEADDPEQEAITAPRSALRTRTSAPQVVAWLEALPGTMFERVLFEMASVANKVLVADHADTGDPAAHRRAMERTVGFVGIALAARGIADERQARPVFEAVPVLELFREGFERAVALQSRARRFVREGWPSLHPRAMETLDAPLRAWVGALIERRPLALDATGERREFRSLADLEAARHALDLADLVGRVVTGALGWKLAGMLESVPQGGAPVKMEAIWVAAVARHATSGALGSEAVAADVARSFRERVGEAAARASVASAFVAALRAAGAVDDGESELLTGYTVGCLERLTTGLR